MDADHIGLATVDPFLPVCDFFTLDVADFENTVRAPADANVLKRAADLYRGDLLPSCYDDWIISERERLRQAFIRAMERLTQLLENQRDYPAAISYAQRLLQHDPLHEETYRHLMRLYALSGDRAGALRVYHACATALARELGIEPTLATREEYERLLNADAATLAATPTASWVASAPMVGRDKEWERLLAIWRAAWAQA